MTKEEYINRWGKKSYLIMVLQNRERNRLNRGFKDSGEGRKILYNTEEDL